MCIRYLLIDLNTLKVFSLLNLKDSFGESMATNEWEQRVIARIDELKDEIVQLCQDLIRIPSWDREMRGEAEVAHHVGRTLEKHGIHSEYFASHPSIDNLVATWDTKKGNRRLLFNGHADVVPPGEDWTVDPFKAEIRDGRIYGRGAMDMKGGITTMAMALCTLRDLDVPLKGTLILNVVGDEERQGQLGTTWCIQNIWKKIRADAAIVAEPTGLGLLGYTVCIGEKGPVWVRIQTKGEKAHGSVPAIGKNAIVSMLQLLQHLREKTLPSVPSPLSRDGLIAQIANALGVEEPLIENLTKSSDKSNPLTAGLEAMTKTTMNIGKIQGGVAANVVPDRCEVELDFRILPGQKPQEILDWILGQVKHVGISDQCNAELIECFEGSSIPNYEQEPIVTSVYKASKEFMGPTIYFMVPYATDGRLLRQKGLKSTVVYGPGNMTQAHTADENVKIEALIKVTKVQAIAALRYLGVED